MPKKGIPSICEFKSGRQVSTHIPLDPSPGFFLGEGSSSSWPHSSKMQKCRYVQWCPYSLAKTYPALLWQATEFTNSDDPKLRAPQARRCRGGHALRTLRLDQPVRICGCWNVLPRCGSR